MNIAAFAKKVLPAPAKVAALRAVRPLTSATSALRPPPDFLILGTKRGGTTSLWNYLLQHPLVLPMVPSQANAKSPHYYYWHYDKGTRWYRGHFPTEVYRTVNSRRYGGRAVTGEASPMYLYDPRVPERVHAEMPSVRLIIMLRDPVERAYSHYKERVRAGVEHLSFEEALEAEPDRLSGEAKKMRSDPYYYSKPYDYYSYQDRGVYLPQILRWKQLFPDSQILTIASEDFYGDPALIYKQVTTFLGLPDRPLANARKYNFMPAADMDLATRRSLVSFYRPHNADLVNQLGLSLTWQGM